MVNLHLPHLPNLKENTIDLSYNYQLLKEKFTSEWPFIFFKPIKSLDKDMLFTKISAPNVRYNPTKPFLKLDN